MYLNLLTKEQKTHSLYTHVIVKEHTSFCTSYIKENELFEPEDALRIAKDSDIHIALKILDCEKPFYNETDLKYMKELVAYLTSLPERGSRVETKGGLLAKGRMKYICPNGHENMGNSEFCCVCEENIFGLKPSEDIGLKRFTEKTALLESMLSKND